MEKARYRVTIEALEEGKTLPNSTEKVMVWECVSASMCFDMDDHIEGCHVESNLTTLANWYAQDKTMQAAERLAKLYMDLKGMIKKENQEAN